MESTTTQSSYVPDHIEVVIPKIYSKIPHTLFEGAKNLEEVQKIFHKNFVSTNEQIKVCRKLDKYEVSVLRQNYSDLIENRLPTVQEQLAIILEDTKRVVSEAKDKVSACETQITDLASQARKGEKEITFERDQCYRVPVCGKYLFFAWLNDAFSLINVENISEWDANKIFSQGEQNVEAFKTILGIDIVAILDERKAALLADETEENTWNQTIVEQPVKTNGKAAQK